MLDVVGTQEARDSALFQRKRPELGWTFELKERTQRDSSGSSRREGESTGQKDRSGMTAHAVCEKLRIRYSMI